MTGNDREIARIRDEAIRRALNTSPKPRREASEAEKTRARRRVGRF
jgi:hypothetical protein